MIFRDKIIFINEGKIVSIKTIEKSTNKKNVLFEVNDFTKAKILLNNYCINDSLEVYETDETISMLTKELILNNIKVYRICENSNSLRKDFFEMVSND